MDQTGIRSRSLIGNKVNRVIIAAIRAVLARVPQGGVTLTVILGRLILPLYKVGVVHKSSLSGQWLCSSREREFLVDLVLTFCVSQLERL